MITALAIALPYALSPAAALGMWWLAVRHLSADAPNDARDEHSQTLGVGGEGFTIIHVAGAN